MFPLCQLNLFSVCLRDIWLYLWKTEKLVCGLLFLNCKKKIMNIVLHIIKQQFKYHAYMQPFRDCRKNKATDSHTTISMTTKLFHTYLDITPNPVTHHLQMLEFPEISWMRQTWAHAGRKPQEGMEEPLRPLSHYRMQMLRTGLPQS